MHEAKAVSFVGPKGPKKTALLQRIASEFGDFLEISIDDMFDREKFNDLLILGVRTIIIDGFTNNTSLCNRLHKLASSSHTTVVDSDGRYVRVRTPNLLFNIEQTDGGAIGGVIS